MKRRKKNKSYYIGMYKENNEIGIFTVKTQLARFLNISDDTVSRRLSKSNTYENDRYIIWRDVYITKAKMGKAIC
jgi:hypothetical protein